MLQIFIFIFLEPVEPVFIFLTDLIIKQLLLIFLMYNILFYLQFFCLDQQMICIA